MQDVSAAQLSLYEYVFPQAVPSGGTGDRFGQDAIGSVAGAVPAHGSWFLGGFRINLPSTTQKSLRVTD